MAYGPTHRNHPLIPQAAAVASDWWLALWSRADSASQVDLYWLWSWSIIVGVVIVLSGVRTGLFFSGAVRARGSANAPRLIGIL
jgi:hypothetical protein